MKKIVLLDIDDTILDFKACERNAIIKTMEEYGITPSEELIDKYAVINKRLWEKFEKKEISKPELLKVRFVEFFGPLGIKEDGGIINTKYLDYLSNEVFFVENAVELCTYLHKHCKVYVITNAVKRVQTNRLKMANLNQYFDEVFISEEVGFQKPDVRFFEYVYEKIGRPDKDDIIILGDSKTSDIMGGINFGIDTCWFNRFNKKVHPEIEPTYEINNLLSFINIIEK